MTNKQIIIDGVDVSRCDELITQSENTIICEITGYLCNDRQNCYYKQLKRKEQECEELVSKGNQLDKKCKQQSWDIGNLGYKIKNQRHEINNRLKQLDQLKADREEALKQLEFVRTLNTVREAEIRKLSKTLTEIKEIAEKAKKDICNNCGWRNTDSCDPTDYTCGEFIKILQKISEVENEK